MNARSLSIPSAVVLLLCTYPAARADSKGDQIVNHYLDQSARRSAIFEMHVDYKEGDKQPIQLEFTWMRKSNNGLMSHLIKMEAPPSEKGKLLLVNEEPDGDADYIAYRPNSALKKKVRVSGARNYKYKGLTISVQELIGGELRKYDHQYEGRKQINGIWCQEVENSIKPQFKNDSNYPRTVTYFREDNGMLQKWELYGDSGKLEKVIYADEIKKIDGIWTLTVARVEDLKKKGELILKVMGGHYNPTLSNELFNEEYLKQNSK